MKRWRVEVTMVVLVALIAAACSSHRPEHDRAAAQQAVAPAAVALVDLPALVAPADDGSPRGLVGDRWRVHLPPSDDPARPEVGIVGGVRAVLVDGPGVALTSPVTYTLSDALSAKGAAPIYVGTDPNVPDGKLANGGTYQYTLKDSTGQVRGPFTFVVGAAGTVGGAYAAAVEPEVFRSGAGEMGIGISFSTADVGTAPELVATNGVRDGLPPGWTWSGLGSGISKVVVEEAYGFYGVDQIVEVHRDGGGVEVLGCVDVQGWGCSSLAGDTTGTGLLVTFDDAAAAHLSVHDPESGRSWQVETWSAPRDDDPQDQLKRREGRVVSSAAPGGAGVAYTYADATGEDVTKVEWRVGGDSAPMTWRIFRAGDDACGGALPPGFVAAPAGAICGWEMPNGAWYRLLHVDLGGAMAPQIGRVMRLPARSATPPGCEPGAIAGCADAWDQVAVTDWAWSATGHPRAMREPGMAQAVMAGAVKPGDPWSTTEVRFDSLGRVDQVTAAARVPDGARALIDHAYPAPEGFPGATHEQTLAQSATDASVEPLVTAAAVDDGLRRVGTLEADGSRSTEVWRGDKDIQLARIGSDGSALTQVFDASDRLVADYDVPAASIDRARCVPGTTDPLACAPTGGWGQIAGELKTYDGAGVPSGLIAAWYNDRSLSGTPVARTSVDRFDASTSSLQLAPPADGTLADGGAVRVTGALASGKTPERLEVSVKGGSTDGGRIFVNGNYYGGLDGAGGAVDLVEAPGSAALRFELVLTFTQAPPSGLTLVDATDDLDITYKVASTKQRWGVVTEERSIEAAPAGSSTFSAVANQFAYADHEADASTSSSTVACGIAGSWDAAAGTCSGPAITSKRAMEPDGFGGVRLASTTSAEGETTTYDYWGRSETPASAGVPQVGDLPDAVGTTAQHGLVRAVHHPDGRTVTTAYDASGRPVCTLTSGDGSGAWSCTEYDGAERVRRETFRSAAGGAEVTVDYAYTLGAGPSPRTATQTRSDDGQVVSTEKVSLSAAGRVNSYELRLDGPGGAGAAATTVYSYDALDRPTGTATTVTADGSTASFSTGRSYQPRTGLLDIVTVGGAPAAQVRYGGPSPWMESGVSFPSAGSLSMSFRYDAGLRPSGRSWTLSDQTTIDDETTVTSSGRMLANRFDGVDTTYGYDGLGRLVSATTGSATSMYGWDDDHNMVCAARGLTGPADSCAAAAGHVTNTYDGGRLVATTDATLELPADAYDADGNLAGVGARTLAYDGRQQLSAIEQGDETIAIGRDSSGRVLTRTDSAGTTRLLYAAPDDPTPVAVLASEGGVAFSTALPGGALWTSDGVTLTDANGNPAVRLAPDGTRAPDVPTARFGPFGEDLTPPAAGAGDASAGSTPTTAAPTAPTTTASTTTSTTAPTSTTTAPTTTSVAPEEAPATPSSTPTSTTTSTTSTTAPTSTTTSTTSIPSTSTSVPSGDQAGFTPNGWADRVALDADLVNLGQRVMVPSLGIFTGPDPVDGGGCTTYGYTCGDPVNSDDLTGMISTGAIVAMSIGLVFALITPGATWFGGVAAGLLAETVMSVLVSSTGSVLSLMVETWVDKGWQMPSWSSIGEAALTGATIGFASGAFGAALTNLTKFEGPLATAVADYGYGAKLLQASDGGVDGYGLFESAAIYRSFRTMGGVRKILVRWYQARKAGEAFLTAGRRPMVRNALLIFGAKQAMGAATRGGVHEAHLRWGVFE